MRRLQLLDAIDRVLFALHSSGISSFLKGLAPSKAMEAARRPQVPDSAQDLLRAYREFALASADFGPVEDSVLSLFRLQVLAEPGLWAAFLAGEVSPRIIDDILTGETRLAELRRLVAPEAVGSPPTPPGTTGARLEGLSVLVIEEEGHLSRPARLVHVLQGVVALYESHAVLLKIPADTLLVAACDSGSDKSFDFLGVAKAIEALKETLVLLWDRVVFFRERKIAVSVHLIAEALPVLVQIATLAEKKVIGPEQAEILRRQVLDGATQLVNAGAITPDLHSIRGRDVRALTAPEPKLLAAPEQPSEVEVSESGRPPRSRRPRQRPRRINH